MTLPDELASQIIQPRFDELRPSSRPTPIRTDHRAEAEDILGMYASPENDPHGAALAHATLALVEQQRISNRIAAATLYGRDPSSWPPSIREALS